MRPPSAIRDPHARLIESVQGADLDHRMRLHLISVARQDRRESLGTPVLHRAGRVAVLRLYGKVLTSDPENLTLARLVSEMLRGLRSLGMLRPGRMQPTGGSFIPPRGCRPPRPRRARPTSKPNTENTTTADAELDAGDTMND
jgi:hypothetical protein